MNGLEILFKIIGRILGFVKPADTKPTRNAVQSYEHAVYKLGQLVFVSPKCPNTEVAGMVLVVTGGVWYPFRAEMGVEQKNMVPVVAPGSKTAYVEPSYVQSFSLKSAGIEPTLRGQRHGYGCSCRSCVSQLEDRIAQIPR
uniref:Uncharacterized protein n=1 Tax=candidate division WWE3 bacterium TaxID=2053526 RepID=A0A7C4TQ21_UNCKA